MGGSGYYDYNEGENRHHHGHGHRVFGRHGTRNHKDDYSDPNIQNELRDVVNSNDNKNRCGECQSSFPTWCSVNLGVFLCGRCASVHRKILCNRDDAVFSDVKSLSMDKWTAGEVDEVIRLGGNKGNMHFWNPKNVMYPFEGDDDKTKVEQFIRDKYILGKFRYDEVKPEDFGRSTTRGIDREMYRDRSYSSGSRSASQGGFTTNDDKYRKRLRQLHDMGFTDNQLNLQALKRAKGDINIAIDILSSESGTNSESRQSRDFRPATPQRPVNTGPKPAVFDGTDSNSTNPFQQGYTASTAQVATQPVMVQQYLDPATGVIYVDQGQYAQAIQQQMQQPRATAGLMVQQPMVQLQAQNTLALQQAQLQNQMQMQMQMQAQVQAQNQVNKNAIMSLYQRPDAYTTPVEITPTHPMYSQLTQQFTHPQQP